MGNSHQWCECETDSTLNQQTFKVTLLCQHKPRGKTRCLLFVNLQPCCLFSLLDWLLCGSFVFCSFIWALKMVTLLIDTELIDKNVKGAIESIYTSGYCQIALFMQAWLWFLTAQGNYQNIRSDWMAPRVKCFACTLVKITTKSNKTQSSQTLLPKSEIWQLHQTSHCLQLSAKRCTAASKPHIVSNNTSTKHLMWKC